MERYYEDYYQLINDLSLEVEAALKNLPQEGADWSPGPDMNSIGALVAHLTGSTRFWIGHFVGGMAFDRDREAEFQTNGVNPIILKQRLNATLGVVKTVMESLNLEDLNTIRSSPKDGSERTVSYCLGRALEHFGMHTGHIQMTRQLWDKERK